MIIKGAEVQSEESEGHLERSEGQPEGSMGHQKGSEGQPEGSKGQPEEFEGQSNIKFIYNIYIKFAHYYINYKFFWLDKNELVFRSPLELLSKC